MRKNQRSKKPSFKLKPMCAAVLLAFSVNASANPNGGAVVNGSASFNTNGNTLTVTNTPGTIINWQGFSINSNEITHFAQQSASSTVLNRVITSNPSVILGTLSSNGRVFLVNPGGIVFGAGSTVNVAGMVATSLNLSDADFLAGRGNFTLTPGAQAVSNAGNITAQSGGEIYLIAPNVENSGVITAPNGEILLAAGHEVQLVNTLDPSLRVNITAPAGDATNVGQLVASAGRLGLFGTVVKNTGAVSADSATLQGGKIVFKASQRVELGGTVSANGVSGGSVSATAAHSAHANTPGVVVQTGTIDAQGTSGAGGSVQVNADNVLSTAAINVNGTTTGGQIAVVATGDVVTTSGAIYSANGETASGGDILVAAGANSYSSGSYLAQGATGGNIAMTANNLTLSAAKLDVSGTNGGGVIHVGGVLHGAAGFSAQGIALNNAGNLTVTCTTKLIADALQNGNGGEIVLWSDGTTLSGGAISAHGGVLSGNGGFVEVSGKQTLGYAGALDVSAPNGASGTLLLDPANIVIDSTAPQGGVLSGVVSATLVDPHPVAGNKFGSYTTVLTNGNVVVAVPNDSLMANAAGAVYLFDGTTGALISTLTGGYLGDQVGLGGVTALTNGNFVVNSWLWNWNDLGAITWGSGTTGVSGLVSVSNSLLGSFAYDALGAPSVVTGYDARSGNFSAQIGQGGVTALTNGNYVVSSPWAYNNGGMVTWGNGLGGTVGYANAANSLVGSSATCCIAGDFIGTTVVALSNGNYVVGSPHFMNGGLYQGAVTWGDGFGGTTVGMVSATNSLIGSANYDTVGASITALSNGNYVVNSYGWNSNAGAVTWGNGLGGTAGTIAATAGAGIVASLVGTPGQRIGWGSGTFSTDGVVALVGNGNYVVNSSAAGFVTWGNGAGGTIGNLSSANSLQGTSGSTTTKVTVLTNGNYVVANQFWHPGTFDSRGAVTWVSGTTGQVSDYVANANQNIVSAANSLVGSILNDNVGSGGVTALTNGHYVVTSQNWDNGAVVNAGAVTWGNGLVGGTVGAVSSANSLVGSTANDQVGLSWSGAMVVALSNGNYVVGSKGWDSGVVVDVGAATWANGLGGTVGVISAANSLVGTTTLDYVGANITALKGNGNYVVSSNWANGAATGAGAATWGNGTTGTVGTISTANSLVGSTIGDGVGGGIIALPGGNYVVVSSSWDNGAVANVGAVTWADGTVGAAGTIAATAGAGIVASLIGDQANDGLGGYFGALASFTILTNGNYVVNAPAWHGNTGYVGMGSATTGLSGVASAANGAVGAVAGDYLGTVGGNGVRALPNGGYVISSAYYNGGVSTGFGRVTLEGVPRSSIPFALNQGATTGINPLDIAAKLNAGTNVVLQANNDITQTVGSAITATGAGNLTLQAGRHIYLSGTISIVGNLIVTANDSNAIPADRSVGTAVLDTGGATLSAGAMTFTNSGGNILLSNLTTTGTVVSKALGATTLSGTNSMFMLDARDASNAAGSGWVNIASGSTTTTDATLGNPLSLNTLIMSGGTLTVAKTLSIGSGLFLGGGTVSSSGGGMLATGGVTTVITGAATVTGFSVWNNPGTINIDGAGVLTLDGTTLAIYSDLGILNLNGTAATPITSLNGAVISEYAGGVINKNIGSATSQTINAALGFSGPAGQLTAAGGLNVNQGTLILGGAHAGALSGTFNVAAGATLDLGNTQYTFANTSSLMGVGSIQASANAAMNGTLTTAGAIFPGSKNSVGNLSIVGNLAMNAGSGLFLNLNGVTGGQFDVLNVSGTTILNTGTSLSVGGIGAAGAYKVINSGGLLSGTFTTINTDAFTQGAHTYAANALTLNLTANSVAGFVAWDGGAGTMNWNDALNWSADQLPTTADGVYLGYITGAIVAPSLINVAGYYQSNSQLNTSGTFTLQSANDIVLNGGTIQAQSFGGNAINLRANNNIVMGAASSITAVASYAVDVVLNSDYDGSGLGSIKLTDTSIVSHGGNITMGGGLAGTGTGWARGTVDDGISLTTSTLNAGAGSIVLNGRGMDGISLAYGVGLYTNSLLTTTGVGAITINGVGGAGIDDNRGVSIGGGSDVTTVNGDMFINGYGGLGTGSWNYGVTIEGVGTTVGSSGTGSINIEAHGGSVGAAGFTNRGFVLRTNGGVFSSNGAISIVGNGGYDGNGIRVGTSISDVATIISAGGDINLFGISGDGFTSDRGVQLQGSGVLVKTSGNVNISGTSIATGIGGGHNGVRIQDGATVDTSSVVGTNIGSINILAQGGNRGDGFQLVTGSSLRTDFGNITIVAQSGINQSGSTQLVGASISASTISSKRGNIFIGGTSKASFGSNNYGVMVTGASAISTLLTGNVTLIGQGGNGAGASTSLNNGVGVNGNSSVSVVHGLISMFGTAGTVTGTTNRGVEIHGATTSVQATGTGSIYINGVIPGSSAGGFDSGVVVGLGADVATNSGYINITGSGVNGGSNNYGVRVEDDGSTITSTSGNITLTGSGATTGTNNYGIGITNANTAAIGSMVSSGSGNLKIVSKAGDVLLSGASTGTGVIASPIGGSTTISSQRNIIVDSALAFNTSPVTLRVDNAGTGVGALSGAKVLTAGTLNFYYNPGTFGTQDALPAQISATTLNRWMLVNTAANLQAIGVSPANLAGSYALGNNLDMTGVVGYTPIGSTATPFTGNFDGLNREISNLTISTPAVSQVGLFGVIGATGVVKNLGMTNVVISGDASVGALAGVNRGSIFNTYVSGGTVTGGNGATGGLVGVNQAGAGTAAIGIAPGVAGSNASISNSYVEKVNVAVMAAANPAVGGLVGINRGGLGGVGGNGAASQMGAAGGAGGAAIITNTYVSGGTVSGMGVMAVQYVGGLVGQNIGGAGGNGGAGNSVITAGGMGGAGGAATISSSYSSSGAVSGTAGQVGGLIGNNVSGTAGTAGAGLYGGGLGAAGIASASAVAWDGVTTGQAVNAIGAGNLNAVSSVGAFSTQIAYAGFDFTNTWWSAPGSTRPFLRSEWSNEINNAHQLQLMNSNLGAHYTLGNDIDLTGALTVGAGSLWGTQGFDSIGSTATPFTGLLAGQGFTISGLKINSSTINNVALFDTLGAGARIGDFTLSGATFSGASNVGALAGQTNGALIYKVDVSGGSISATGLNTGGLVGSASNTLILGSHVGVGGAKGNGVAVSINSTSGNIGGLVGNNTGGAIVNSSISGGSVNGYNLFSGNPAWGNDQIGGLVGINTDGLIAGGLANGALTVKGFNSTGGLVGNNAGLLVNSSLDTVSMSEYAYDNGGLAGTNSGSIINSKVANITFTTTGSGSTLGGAIGSNSGLLINSQFISGAITSGVNSYNVGVMIGFNGGMSWNTRYDIDAVTLNGATRVQQGGLYTAQFNEWQTTGRLNIANYNTSLTPGGNLHTIATTQGMQDLIGFADDPRYHFQLGAGITALPTNYSVPVLAASFEGAGFNVGGLNTAEQGLFSHVLKGGAVSNLGILDPVLNARYKVGGLVGWNEGLISNSFVSGGTITNANFNSSNVGGLVGLNDGAVINSYAEENNATLLTGALTVTAGSEVANLVGSNGINGLVKDSYVTGGTLHATTGDSNANAGGLVGSNAGRVVASYVSGGVISGITTSGQWNFGGLVGLNTGSIDTSYVSGGSISALSASDVGGLVGNNSYNGIISNSYVSGGSVTAKNTVGGLVGNNFGSINNSYVSGGSVTDSVGVADVAGLVAADTGAVSNSYYDIDGVLINNAHSVMQHGLYSTDALGNVGAGQFAAWRQSGHQALDIANYSSAGQSLELNGLTNAYTISNVQGMRDLLGFADAGFYNFALGADINLTGYAGLYIPVLAGSFDGQGHTISNLKLNEAHSNVGLFGRLSSEVGGVNNLGLINAQVTGTDNVGALVGYINFGNINNSYATGTVTGAGSQVGGLVGNSSGSINNSYAASVVTGSYNVGGLVGNSFNTVSTSYATGAVNGSFYVGGLVGSNAGSIDNSYANGVVTGGSTLGGLVGFNSSSIVTSYATGAVTGASGVGGLVGLNGYSATVANGYWDNSWDATSLVQGVGSNSNLTVGAVTVTALNSAQMKTQASFAGFDFTTTWRMYEGQSVPLLKAFLTPLTVAVAGSRVYDGTTNVAALATYRVGQTQVVPDTTLLGTVVADTASVNASVNPYTVTPTGGLYSTSQNGYDISYAPGSVTITPAAVVVSPLTVKANNASKTYGTTLNFAGTEFTPVGLLNGDTITGVTLTSAGAVNTANAGSYSINVTPGSEVFGQGLASNYTLTYSSGTLTVNPASLTVSAIVQTKVYGDADPSLTYTSSGLLFSDALSGSLGRAAGQNVGTYAINQGTLNNPNYAITFTGNTLSITPRDITVASSSASKVYGDADPNIFSVGGSGLASWDTNATAFTGSLGHLGGENVGTYSITQGNLAANANYNVSAFNISGSIIITPAPLTVVANSQNKVLGTPDPLLTYMTYGLKLNDTAATTLSGELDRDIGDTVGTYSINQGNLTLLSSNYTMTYQAGTFRILAPTVVQEITQMTMQSAPAEDTATTSAEEEKKESAELLAEAAIVDDSGQPLADPLPVCR